MNEFRDKLRGIEQAPPPELWPQIVNREPSATPISWPSRFAIIGIAIFIAAAGITLAVLALGRAHPGGPDVLPVIGPTSYPNDPRCKSPDRPGLLTCQQVVEMTTANQPRAEVVAAKLGLRRAGWYGERWVRVWRVTLKNYQYEHPGIAGPPEASGCAISNDWTIIINARNGHILQEGGTGSPTPCPPTPPSSSASASPSDPRCQSPDQPGLITCEQAIESAKQPYAEAQATEAKLGWYTDSQTPRTRVWNVTLRGVPLSEHGPPYGCSISDDWVVTLDAIGGYVFAEGGSGSATPCPSSSLQRPSATPS